MLTPSLCGAIDAGDYCAASCFVCRCCGECLASLPIPCLNIAVYAGTRNTDRENEWRRERERTEREREKGEKERTKRERERARESERPGERERDWEREILLSGYTTRTVTSRRIHYVTIAFVFTFCTHTPSHARVRASQALDTCCVAESSRTRNQCVEAKSMGDRTEGGETFPQVDICVLRSMILTLRFRERPSERESASERAREMSLGGTTRLLHSLIIRWEFRFVSGILSARPSKIFLHLSLCLSKPNYRYPQQSRLSLCNNAVCIYTMAEPNCMHYHKLCVQPQVLMTALACPSSLLYCSSVCPSNFRLILRDEIEWPKLPCWTTKSRANLSTKMTLDFVESFFWSEAVSRNWATTAFSRAKELLSTLQLRKRVPSAPVVTAAAVGVVQLWSQLHLCGERRAMPVKSEPECDIDTMDGTYDCCICTNTTKGTANIMQCMTCSSNPVCACCYANWGQTVCSTCNGIVFITPKRWICSLYLSITFWRVLKNMGVTLFFSLSAQNSMEPVDKPRTEKAHTFLDLSIDAPRAPVHEDKNQVVKCNSFCGLTFLHAMFLVLHARIFASISVT